MQIVQKEKERRELMKKQKKRKKKKNKKEWREECVWHRWRRRGRLVAEGVAPYILVDCAVCASCSAHSSLSLSFTACLLFRFLWVSLLPLLARFSLLLHCSYFTCLRCASFSPPLFLFTAQLRFHCFSQIDVALVKSLCYCSALLVFHSSINLKYLLLLSLAWFVMVP